MTLLLACLKVFFARICDVSLGTLRTVFFVKGKTLEPFVIAFFEVTIWFLVAREALNTDQNIYFIAFSYAAGYASGTFIGSKLSNIFIKGMIGVQVIVHENQLELINKLREKGFALSVIELKDNYDNKDRDMLYIQINSGRLKELQKIIKEHDEKAFIIINETKVVQNGMIK